jgi:capsid assembly protease
MLTPRTTTEREHALCALKLLTRSPFWAIQPEYLPILMGHAVATNWECAKPHTEGRGEHKTTVIPVQGVLTKDGPSWMGSSYDSIADAAEKAADDPKVKKIVLAVDSPGGEVTGLPETANVLAQAAKVKPLHSIVEGTSASAAYWLTSQSAHISLTPSGEVGSVGVRMMHMDWSKMMDEMGIKVTELYSGEFKTEWSPFQPLTDGAKADMQKRLVAVHQDFINGVATGRGVRATADSRGSRFGEGRMLSATDALKGGLVDKIESPRAFYRAIMPPQEEKTAGPEYGFPISQQHLRARIEVEKRRF